MSAAVKCPGAAGARKKVMLSPAKKETLSKMYSLVGSHSAVKLCRWQKAMMRGRGGCYKYTMYGIKSHRCMEATPSMGCANKCTFCWRHNSNPTIKEWNFETDPPEFLVTEMLKQHQKLVHNAKGMPGVTKDGYSEAMAPAHCALSLVGEPIAYPRISEFLTLLHERRISTFLVNNGQFPEAIRDLTPICQLYLSADAPNKAQMKELDRPIFPDFWERFQRSVGYMSEKKGRTVFRLTLIKGFNDDDVEGYAAALRRGRPTLIEIKQVTPTFQGNKKSPFRMENVPKWDDVLRFGAALCEAIDGGESYAVSCAHEHSSCLLLASKELLVGGKWHTWIDFEKFGRLILDPAVDHAAITPGDIAQPTPDSAVAGAAEGGFDPAQARRYTNKQQRFRAADAQAAADVAAGASATA
jgi:tRNA wybutosine-synthesizing protein 1